MPLKRRGQATKNDGLPHAKIHGWRPVLLAIEVGVDVRGKQSIGFGGAGLVGVLLIAGTLRITCHYGGREMHLG